MRRVEISPEARVEITEITTFSRETFGSVGAARYAKLIQTGLRFAADAPEARASRVLSPGIRMLHLRHLPDTLGVKSPRHVLVYRFNAATLDLLHVFQDAMDLPARLSDV
ncbi:type II toxin-antitoxin system RelE/ParE family toxin [Brevundimonas sp.]|jgi:plasmid stabilization system protein ParE|uniref:type II toxin-antitoxin system RelE/ParE family toxin n=1 Tax=Brevundimonas sp. TaxID=1871086 RepID=UPI0037834EDF